MKNKTIEEDFPDDLTNEMAKEIAKKYFNNALSSLIHKNPFIDLYDTNNFRREMENLNIMPSVKRLDKIYKYYHSYSTKAIKTVHKLIIK